MRAVLAKDRDFAERTADTSLSADLRVAEFAQNRSSAGAGPNSCSIELRIGGKLRRHTRQNRHKFAKSCRRKVDKGDEGAQGSMDSAARHLEHFPTKRTVPMRQRWSPLVVIFGLLLAVPALG